jgi:hypothetical protein
MQETYLYLNQDCDPDKFFLRRSLWDKILEEAKTDAFTRFYIMLKHAEEYEHLWICNDWWICSYCANGFLHPWVTEIGTQ